MLAKRARSRTQSTGCFDLWLSPLRHACRRAVRADQSGGELSASCEVDEALSNDSWLVRQSSLARTMRGSVLGHEISNVVTTSAMCTCNVDRASGNDQAQAECQILR